MSEKKTDPVPEEYKEKFLNSTLGYLRLPVGLKQRFGSPTRWPDAEGAEIEVDDKHIKVIYLFPREKMEELEKTKDNTTE